MQNNGLFRIADSTQRPQNSLLRALSMCIFYSHGYAEEVLREVRLTLASNLGDKRSNCYPAINETNILKKYQSSPDLLLDFWDTPDLPCFHPVRQAPPRTPSSSPPQPSPAPSSCWPSTRTTT